MKNMKMMAAGMCLLTVVSCQTKQGTGALIGGGGGAGDHHELRQHCTSAHMGNLERKAHYVFWNGARP